MRKLFGTSRVYKSVKEMPLHRYGASKLRQSSDEFKPPVLVLWSFISFVLLFLCDVKHFRRVHFRHKFLKLTSEVRTDTICTRHELSTYAFCILTRALVLNLNPEVGRVFCHESLSAPLFLLFCFCILASTFYLANLYVVSA